TPTPQPPPLSLHDALPILEERGGGGEVLAGLRLLSGPAVERSEAAMTVTDQGAHAEVGGQAPRLAKVPFGGLAVGPMRGNLAEEAEGIGFVAVLTAGTRVGE